MDTATNTQPTRIDKYILLEKIAVGGMAEVWLASSTQVSGITKFVAIKKILPHLAKDAEFIRMFKDEAAVVMNLSHSNIVSITGYYQSAATNELYLVMDFVEGRNLRQVLEKMNASETDLSLTHIVYIIKEIAAGLSHAHHSINSATGQPLNIIHRDVSPQNCMISFGGEVKVVDFGISKADTERDKTEIGTLKGKFGYMSPEQAEGRQVDRRTDIFSLGIIFWELLTGQRLFTGKNEISILKKISECQIPPLEEFVVDVNPEVEKIVRKALSKDPEMRYSTASAMHRDLSRFLNTYDPDFTTPDFSIFIRTLFAGEVIEARQKLVKYSQVVNELNSNANSNSDGEPAEKSSAKKNDSATMNEDRTEIWTFDQAAKTSEPAVATKKVVGEKFEIKPRATSVAAASATSEDGENFFANLEQEVLKGPSSPPADMAKSSSAVRVPKPIKEDPKDASVVLETKSSLAPTKEGQFAKQAAKATAESAAPKKDAVPAKPDPVMFVWPTPAPSASSNQQRSVAAQRPAYTPAPSGGRSSGLLVKFVVVILLMITGGFFAMKSGLLEPKPEPVAVKTPAVVPVKVPEFLLEDNTVTETNPSVPMETVLFKSVPSGAEIWIDRGDGFKNTGGTTPSRVDVPREGSFHLKFRKFRYEEFEAKNLLATQLNGQFEGSLAAQKIAYLDILANRSPRDVKVFINDMQIEDARLPMIRFEIPANMNVNVRIESPSQNLKIEKSLNVKEGDRSAAQFTL